jgi:ABC-type lipoprotein export system ATPase subunit
MPTTTTPVPGHPNPQSRKILDNKPGILAAQDLHKSCGRGSTRFDALTGVSMTMDAGESIVIVGKIGSGKSTLIHLLALLDQPRQRNTES